MPYLLDEFEISSIKDEIKTQSKSKPEHDAADFKDEFEDARVVRNYPSTKTPEKSTLIVYDGLLPPQRSNPDYYKQKYDLYQIRGLTPLPQQVYLGDKNE